jgi:hypothetical protein
MAFSGFQSRSNIHNYTSIPNEFFEEVLPFIETMSELKIILAIFRKTYGWVDRIENGEAIYKLEDSISYSQFRSLTGLSDSSISDGIKLATEHGYIIKVKTGGLGSGSSRYRLRQVNDPPMIETPKLPPSEASEEIPTKPLIIAQPVQEESKPSKKETKEDILNELGYVTKQPDAPKKKKRIDPLSKPTDAWNCNDLLSFFTLEYKRILGIPYSMISAKDRSNAKRLLEQGDLGVEDIKKAIEYYLKNYRNIDGLPKGFPSWGVFIGWKNTIIPLALLGNDRAATGKSNMSVREFQETNNTSEKLAFNNGFEDFKFE